MTKVSRVVSALLLLLMLGLVIAPSSSLAANGGQSNNSIKVQRYSFPVTLSDGNSYNIVGYLYYKGSYHNRILQVAVHGGTYNHNYWDVPTINGHDYSYARYMADEHYAVLAIDQLGAGESSKPNGDYLTLAETANGVHQVLQSLRTNSNPIGYRFNQIVLVGHSIGSMTAVYAQATWHDADALVTTGLGHVAHAVPLDPQVVQQIVQFPYVMLPAQIRSPLFYYPGDADQAVIDYDNQHLSDTLTRGQFITVFTTLFDDNATKVNGVTGPVLVQLGENDALFPAVFASDEASHWTSTQQVTVQTLANTGHDFNTHLNNTDSWTAINAWIEAQFDR